MTYPRHFVVEPGWCALIEDLGLRPEDVLRHARLPQNLSSRSAKTLTVKEQLRLWKSIESHVHDPALPIRVAEVVTTDAFSPPVLAVLCSPNLKTAAERIAAYRLTPVTLAVEHRPDSVVMSLDWPDAMAPGPPSLAATGLALVVRLLRMATREQVVPLNVVAPDQLPQCPEYEHFFGIAIERGERASLTFSRKDSEKHFATANEFMWEILEPGLRRRLNGSASPPTLRQQAHAALVASLPDGRCTVDRLAARLGMDRVTLQCRLQDEGTSFRQVLHQAREGLARDHLANAPLSRAEISFLLGFLDRGGALRQA